MSDGLRLVQEGDKALSSASGGFSFFSNKESKLQDASDKYVAAAQAFRMDKKYVESGQAYEKAAYVHREKLNEPDDAARYNDDASKQYREAGMVEDAKRTLDSAAIYWNAKNNPTRAGSARAQLGDWLEKTARDYHGALEQFQQAAELYKDKTALSCKYLLKVAEMMLMTRQFDNAVQVYETLIDKANGLDALKYSIKNYVFSMWLCKLATAPGPVEALKVLGDISDKLHLNSIESPATNQQQFFRALLEARIPEDELKAFIENNSAKKDGEQGKKDDRGPFSHLIPLGPYSSDAVQLYKQTVLDMYQKVAVQEAEKGIPAAMADPNSHRYAPAKETENFEDFA